MWFKKWFKRNKKTPEAPIVRVVPHTVAKDHLVGGPMDYHPLNRLKRWSKGHRSRNDMRSATKKGAQHKRMKLKLVLNEDKMRFKVTP